MAHRAPSKQRVPASLRPARRNRPSAEERARLVELEALYAETDAAHAGHRCPSATECCRFGITGREPYVTSIELVAVERALAARGGPVPAKRRALPLLGGRDERTCPLLAEGGRCAVYAWRPFGCRTYWCERTEAVEPLPHAAKVALVRKLQGIAARHRPGGELGRPLTRALAQGLDGACKKERRR